MRYFARDGSHVSNGDTLEAFGQVHSAQHPYAALNLRACDRLCSAGRLFNRDGGPGLAAMKNRYWCSRTLAELQPNLDYGTFEFIVDGFLAIRNAFASSVRLLEITTSSGKKAHGTSFQLTDTILLTARHCVADAADVRITAPELPLGYAVPYVLVPAGDYDVVGLLIARSLAARAFRVREVELLEPVLTLGYPLLQGFHPTLLSSSGEICGKARAYLDGNDYWITTCSMTGGSSGGPIVGADGAVVGVVSGLPASDAGIDPGRFGLLAPCKDALLAVQQAVRDGTTL